MQLSNEEFSRAGADSRAVIEQAKAAGVYVFGGGIDESVSPVLVAADGSVAAHRYAGSEIDSGLTVLESPTRRDAEEWERKVAAARRCSQEIRDFIYDRPANHQIEKTGELVDAFP